MKNLSYLIFVLFISCKNENNKDWEKIKVDKRISKNPVYAQMDKQKESYSFGITDKPRFSGFQDTTFRKTRQVTTYHISDTDSDIYTINQYICRASYLRNIKEIKIWIGYGSPFGGSGLTIITENNQFNAKPFYVTDVHNSRQKPPKFQILKQELILDKSKYQIGDSLYGKIYYHIIENRSYPDDDEIIKIEHVAQGYFRAKVNKGDPNAEAVRLRD